MLTNERQWVGILVRPINYSLKGAVLYIDTGPGLEIDDSHVIEMESSAGVSQNDDQVQKDGAQTGSLNSEKKFECLTLNDGKIEFPNWATDTPSIIWVLVRAISDTLSRGSSSGEDGDRNLDVSIHVYFIFNHMYLFWLFFSVTTRRESIVDAMRTIALKLEFGVFHNQIFERFFHFPSFLCFDHYNRSYSC